MGDCSEEYNLWQATLLADEDAFAELYNLHADRIYAFCRRRGASELDGQDVVAETFLQLWRQRARIEFDLERGLLPWLFTVAGRLLQRITPPAIPAAVAADIPDPALLVVDREEQGRIRALLDGLDPADRALAVDLWVNGLNSAEVAARAGVAPGTVRWRAHRLRARLRRAWMSSADESGDS